MFLVIYVLHIYANFQVNELFTDSQQVLEETSQELSTTKERLCSTRIDLASTKQDLHLTKQERDEKGFLVEEHAKTEHNLHEKATQVGTYSLSMSRGLYNSVYSQNSLLGYTYRFLLKLQLVTTVQDAIGDVEGLHSKLERKRHVESSNQATHMKYQRKFHSEVSSMMADLEGFASSQQQICSDFSNKIGEYQYS